MKTLRTLFALALVSGMAVMAGCSATDSTKAPEPAPSPAGDLGAAPAGDAGAAPAMPETPAPAPAPAEAPAPAPAAQ